jgi:electron transport complex protein RnfG
MMKLPSNPIASAGVTLGAFALVGVILLASIQWLTSDLITDNIRQRHLKLLHDIIPIGEYDNDLLGSKRELSVDMDGVADTVKVYTASLAGNEISKVFEVTSVEGYSGSISLLVGVNTADQSLSGVRVVAHKETPGLGDKIETAKADWIYQFTGKSLSNPALDGWSVKKDGGVFDQFTGATITPRAVVNTVRQTLQFVAKGLPPNE